MAGVYIDNNIKDEKEKYYYDKNKIYKNYEKILLEQKQNLKILNDKIKENKNESEINNLKNVINIQKDLIKNLEKNSDLGKCQICIEKVVSIRLNCCHTICDVCVQNLENCPFCSENITKKDKIYLM
jgi:hypothetical protein